MRIFLVLTTALSLGYCRLWPKGVVHYAVNQKDYDIHSQDEIAATFARIESEICVKFFHTPFNYSATKDDKILYLSNRDKRKDCPLDQYNYNGSVVEMTIGYKCINQKDIARITVDMLRASIQQTDSPINSYDLIKKFKEQNNVPRPTLLTPVDRNFINAHYHAQCAKLGAREAVPSRRFNDGDNAPALSVENWQFYSDKIWPLGIVMFGVDKALRATADYASLLGAMSQVEYGTCVLFQEVFEADELKPRNVIWFGEKGEEMPSLGFPNKRMDVQLAGTVRGTTGHAAHALASVLRVLGVPMMSNRYDRGNFINVQWKNIEKGKERFLEKMPPNAWVKQPYDFLSATHAPANYMALPLSWTVVPLQEHLWEYTLRMGQKAELTDGDKQLVNLLYGHQCQQRILPS